MPSRIDIGPEGGPFVAINENSNDLELQDINGNVIAVWDETEGQWDLNNNSLTNINAIDASSATLGSLNTKVIADEWHYAGDYDGADVDTRLDNALSAASNGETIHLEPSAYTSDRTISKRLTLVGQNGSADGTIIDADWTLDGIDMRLSRARVETTGLLTFASDFGSLSDLFITGSVSITADDVTGSLLTGNGSIAFETGTENGEIGAISGSLSTSDNSASNSIL